MNIALDAIMLTEREAGSVRHVLNLTEALQRYGPGNTYHLFCSPVLAGRLEPGPNLHLHLMARPRLVPRALWQQAAFARSQVIDRHALVHHTVYFPAVLADYPAVQTVHDLTFVLYPRSVSLNGRLWWRFLARRGLARARRLIAVSESVKADLVRVYHLSPAKIDVIYSYAAPVFAPRRSSSIGAKYALPPRYILAVATWQPLKNLAALLHGFAVARAKTGLPHALVLVGTRGWGYSEIEQAARLPELQESVRLLGVVPDADLVELYSTAEIFVLPSLYEGFGLPLLEAMACGAPVACSRRPAPVELAGEAGLFFDPRFPEDIAAAICELAENPLLRVRLRERGLARARMFSAERTARETLQAYQAALL